MKKRGPNGGQHLTPNGYLRQTINHKRMQVHRAIAEAVLGRPLKSNEVVHHINGDRADNSNSNLLICTASYHQEIHRRQDALMICGNANWHLCVRCKKYDDPQFMVRQGKGSMEHRACRNEHARNMMRKRKWVNPPLLFP
jgi:hypothetical protein